MTTQRDIDNITERVRQAPQNQRAGALIDNLANQMTSSNDQGVQQFGETLRRNRHQLVNAVQQQQE